MEQRGLREELWGYFDRLAFGGLADGAADVAFRKKSDGRGLVFYPWGAMGNGYIVTPSKESQLRAFLRIYMRISASLFFLAAFLGVVFAGVLLSATTVLLAIPVLLVIIILGYAAIMPYVIADMPCSTEKRSFAEEYKYVQSSGKITPETLRPMLRSHSGVWILAVVLHCVARAFWLG